MKLSIELGNGDRVEVPGIYLGTPGLAVNHSWDVRYMKSWSVTHVPSGYFLLRTRTLCAALRACKALGCLADWTRPVRELQHTRRQVVRIRRRYERLSTLARREGRF